MKRILSCIGTAIIMSAGISAIITTNSTAHIGDNPHIGNARWDGVAHVNLNLVAPIAPGWHFEDVKDEFNADMSWDPVMHKRECGGNPGKCITVVNNGTIDGCASMDRNSGSPDILRVNGGSECPVGPNQATICRALWYLAGGHFFHGPTGCGRIGFTTANIHFSDAQEAALDAAYCDGAGCRSDGEDDGPEELLENPLPSNERHSNRKTICKVGRWFQPDDMPTACRD